MRTGTMKMIARRDLFGFLLTISVLSISLRDVQSQVGNAGVKVVLTKRALDYAAEHAVEVLAKEIPQTQLDNFAGSTKLLIGRVEYEINDARITSFTKPSANVALNPGRGLTMSLSEGRLSASGNWRYRYKKAFIKIRDSGSFTASASGISISVSVTLGVNSDGGPTVSATDCHCSIGDVSFRLKGGASWLYNIFLRFYKRKIRNSFEDISCREARKAINENGVRHLATLKLQKSINDLLIINYRLAASPMFGSDFVEFDHNGRFLNDYEMENAPAMQASTDRMISVSVSDVTFNSASRILYRNNRFHIDHTLSDDVILFEVLKNLNLTDSHHQRRGAHISVSASSPPGVVLHRGSISVSAEVEARIDILNSDGSRTDGILFKIAIDYRMRAEIQANTIIGSVLNFTPRLTYCSISHVDIEKINENVAILANLLVPSIDEALAKGLPLPNVDGVSFQDSVIHLNDRHITVAANAEYLG